MIQKFPNFKRLDFSDIKFIEKYTSQFPSYSDFNFASLLSWDIHGQVCLSELNENLIVKFSDYVTAELFYSFLGVNKLNETAVEIFRLAQKESVLPYLKLVPEVTASKLDKKLFSIIEDRDNWDYIYDLESFSIYEGSCLKKQRNELNSFLRRYPDARITKLDLTTSDVKDKIRVLCNQWWVNKNMLSIPHEISAIDRFFEYCNDLNHIAIGVYIQDKLIAFTINCPTPNKQVNCLFAKGDVEYKGVYAFLMNGTSKILLNDGYDSMNFEQDLGIYSLRKAKEALCTESFLKKYNVGIMLSE